MNWYSRVSKDINQLPDCLEHFYRTLAEAKRDVDIHGNLEKASAKLPGMVEERFNELQEIEAILEYLNIELRRTRSKSFKAFLETYARALSSRDCEKYVDGDADVVDLEKIVNEFALLRNNYLGILKGLEQKSFMIGHITKLRTAGMEDVII